MIKTGLLFLACCLNGSIEKAFASSRTGAGELARLMDMHKPQNIPALSSASLSSIKRKVLFPGQEEPTLIEIPGFEHYGCSQCHQGNELLDGSEQRIAKVLSRLKKLSPESGSVPLKHYIIQPWSGPLLAANQFAHATFDSIRLFPRTILIDKKAYDNNTHLHEILHLTQSFVGHANELEAYSLNAQEDARFLLLNFPYFENAVTAFYLDDFKKILEDYFKRQVKENSVPREVQWFQNEFNAEHLEKVKNAALKMKPLMKKAAQLVRDFPLQSSFLSEQTGVPSLMLDLSAAQTLTLPPITLPKVKAEKAFDLLDEQMNKTDNILLGYKIDRKKEALLHMRYTLNIKDPVQSLIIYFHYLRRWRINSEGEIDLTVSKHLQHYVDDKLKQIDRMLEYPGISPIEKTSGETFKKQILRELKKIMIQNREE